MKRIAVLLILSFAAMNAQAQEENCWSLKFDANTNYNFLTGDYQKFNYDYGLSLLASRYFNRFKISFGMNFSKISVFSEEWDVDAVLNYLNIPVLGSFSVYSSNNVRLNITGGIIGNIGYKQRLYNSNDREYESIILFYDNSTNLSVRAALEYSQKIFSNFYLNVSPFVDWRINANSNDRLFVYKSDPLEFLMIKPQYNFSIGINIGFEYMFRKNNND